MGFRFLAVPAHQLAKPPASLPSEERLEATLPAAKDAVEHALNVAQFRDLRARDRVFRLIDGGEAPFASPGEGWSPCAVFARSPTDLPALLRLADELEAQARAEAGERALVWKCASCGKRYAVPVTLARPVAIRCEGCGKPVELVAGKSSGEEALLDPFQGSVNAARWELARLFREAMARGWPVLVSVRQ
ncbi:MAG: hypothetical protein ACOZIN_17255 [Myxococcota bacterium]